jgi:hypothetical protein
VQAKDYFLKLVAAAILDDEPVAVFAELGLSPPTVTTASTLDTSAPTIPYKRNGESP